MRDHERQLSPSEVAQTTANLRLAAQFVRELIEHPELHEAVPDDGTVVLLPGDDSPNPELSRVNTQMAYQLAAEGKNVTTWTVGLPVESGLQVLPRWPSFLGEGSGFTYDRRRDVLTAVFSATDRPTIPAPMNAYTTVLIDAETRTATSMTISKFIEEAVQKAPSLAVFLLHPSTRLIGMTQSEVHAFLVKLAHDLLGPGREEATWGQILDELSA